MEKWATLVVFLASMIMPAYNSTIPSPCNTNPGRFSCGMMNVADLAWLHSRSEGKDVRPTASANSMMAGSLLTAAAADDDGKKNGDVDGESKKDSDQGDKSDKEKEDEGGWDRLWDAPKQG